MEQSSRARPGDGAVIYQSTILTMDPQRPSAEAVIVKDGAVLVLGSIDDLVQAYPGASFDERFLRRTLLPAFVDVRVSPNSLKVLEVPCQGALLAEDIVSAGADGAPVRIVASEAVGLAAAIEAVNAIPASAEIGRVSVESRGPITVEAARRLTEMGVPLILSDGPAPPGCGPDEAAPADAAAGAVPMISGRIALAPAMGADTYLAVAGARLGAEGSFRLSPQEALEAITADAAFAHGAESQRGVIAAGRRADFAALARNPLATPGEAWGAIGVEAYSDRPAE